jgi:hypothetical protein
MRVNFFPNELGRELFHLKEQLYSGRGVTPLLLEALGEENYNKYIVASDPFSGGKSSGEVSIILNREESRSGQGQGKYTNIGRVERLEHLDAVGKPVTQGVSTAGSSVPSGAPAAESGASLSGTLLGKAGRIAGKVALPVAVAAGAAETAYDLYKGDHKGATEAASGTTGAIAGGIAGAEAGAAAGAAVGSVVPVVGTAAGAVVGSIVGGVAGGVAGYWGGSRAGAAAYDAVAGSGNGTNEKPAPIAVPTTPNKLPLGGLKAAPLPTESLSTTETAPPLPPQTAARPLSPNP